MDRFTSFSLPIQALALPTRSMFSIRVRSCMRAFFPVNSWQIPGEQGAGLTAAVLPAHPCFLNIPEQHTQISEKGYLIGAKVSENLWISPKGSCKCFQCTKRCLFASDNIASYKAHGPPREQQGWKNRIFSILKVIRFPSEAERASLFPLFIFA